MGALTTVAFVPTAGKGWKVRKLAGRFTDGHNAYAVPKFRLTTAGVPVAYTTLRNLQKAGIAHLDITYSLSPPVQSLKAYVEGHPRFADMNIKLISEPQLKGTAISLAEALLARGAEITPDTEVIVYYGDILCNLDLGAMLQAHRDSGSLATVAVNAIPLEHAHKFGQVILEGFPETDFDGPFSEEFATHALGVYGKMRRIKNFVPKDKDERKGAVKIESLFTDSSIYIFQASVIQAWIREAMEQERHTDNRQIDTGIFSYIFKRRELFERFYAYAIPVENYWRDIGTYSDIWLATMDALDGIFPLPFSFPQIAPRIWRHDSTVVSESAHLIPPVAIEEGVTIGDNAIVGPYVHVGAGWTIEPNAHVAGTYLPPPTSFFEGDVKRSVGKYARIVQSIIAGGQVPAHADIKNSVGYLYRDKYSSGENERFHRVSMGADPILADERVGAAATVKLWFFSVEKTKASLQ